MTVKPARSDTSSPLDIKVNVGTMPRSVRMASASAPVSPSSSGTFASGLGNGSGATLADGSVVGSAVALPPPPHPAKSGNATSTAMVRRAQRALMRSSDGVRRALAGRGGTQELPENGVANQPREYKTSHADPRAPMMTPATENPCPPFSPLPVSVRDACAQKKHPISERSPHPPQEGED